VRARQRQLVFDAANRDAEHLAHMISDHVGEIVKDVWLTASVRLIRIYGQDDAGLLDDLIHSLDITVHRDEHIYDATT
jgi:hypothetical protein